MEVNQLRDVFSWASTATDNGSDCNGVLMYFLQKIQLLSPGWGFCFKGEVFFCEWVYDSFLVHGVYVSVDGFSEVDGGVCIDFFVYGFI